MMLWAYEKVRTCYEIVSRTGEGDRSGDPVSPPGASPYALAFIHLRVHCKSPPVLVELARQVLLNARKHIVSVQMDTNTDDVQAYYVCFWRGNGRDHGRMSSGGWRGVHNSRRLPRAVPLAVASHSGYIAIELNASPMRRPLRELWHRSFPDCLQ